MGTPVGDKSTNTLYFVSRYRDINVDNATFGNSERAILTDPDWTSAGFYQLVHALDLSTGAEKFNGPGTDRSRDHICKGYRMDHNANSEIHFDPRRENQRGWFVHKQWNCIYSIFRSL